MSGSLEVSHIHVPREWQTSVVSSVDVELQKALYGTLQAAILFWKDLTKFLTEELGFIINLYDSCIVNKIIDGKQCTIIWHVDDLKLSHIKQSVWKTLPTNLIQSMARFCHFCYPSWKGS